MRLIRRVAMLMAVCTALALFAPSSTSAGASGGVRLGISAGWVNGKTVQDRINQVEGTYGNEFGAIRLYHAWDEWFPQPGEAFLKNAGRDTVPILSISSTRRNGEHVYWSQVANLQSGSQIHQDLMRWADDLKAYGKPIVVAFNHEPDYYRGNFNGDPAQYRTAFQRFAWILRNRGATNVKTAFIGVAWNWDSRSSTNVLDYYPGDHWVDVLGVDGYVWGNCRDPQGPWRSVNDVFAPFLAWAAQRPSKPIAVAEFGVAEDPAAVGWRKGQETDRAMNDFAGPQWNRLEYLTYWDAIHQHDRGCDFRIDSSWGASQAFGRAIAHPAFQG